MLFKRTTLHVAFTLLLTQTPSMHGITMFGYDFDVTSRLSVLYSSIQNYMWSSWSNSTTPQNNDINQRAVNRANTILSHINPPHKQSTCTLQNGSNRQIDLIGATPKQIELFMQNSTNIPQLRKEISNGIGRVPLANLKVLWHNPDLADCFIQPATNNFSQWYNTKLGWYILDEILRWYPDAAQTYVQPFIDNFSQMCNNEYGRHTLHVIMYYPIAAQAFVQPAIDNFSLMCSDDLGRKILGKILDHCPTAAQAFVQPAIDNFSLMCSDGLGRKILGKILDHCPTAAQAFVQPAIDNFSLICNNYRPISNYYGDHIIEKILKCHPDGAQELVLPAIDNFSHMCKSEYGSEVLKMIIKHHPDATQAFTKQMAGNPRFFYPFNDLVEHKSQTKQHLIANLTDGYKRLSSEGNINYQDHNALQKMTKQLIDLEHKEQQEGRYTFVHAHLWDYHFCQELYTDLWSISNEKPPNYRFIRFTYPEKPSLKSFVDYIQKEQEARQKIINGAFAQNFFRDGYQNRLLFMNYALFVNSQGSNTSYYIKQSISALPINIDCNQFLTELHLDKLLTQKELEYANKQLNDLQREHATLSEYGGGLLLSFTPELMAQCVYPCHGSGRKRTVEIEGLGKTSDPQVILDILRSTPEKIVNSDRIEFACVLSHDCTLIPNNGLDIYEFNAADQDKLAAWRAKKDRLMAWIKERVNKKRQTLAAAQAATQKMRARL